MAVTADKYELPLAVEDTGAALARLVGCNPNNIYHDISAKATGTIRGFKFVKVTVDETMENATEKAKQIQL
ncbi:hypothetical protein F1904_13125 [Akkermansia muciniphila]|uniref:hypothetical protein n=1 Tax=Akkermansia muciniphila TaxID=239935 RepID=UPI00122F2698|nr:hypothetical protein F1904_13125 [Akkermansia muciniphila]